MDPILSTFCRSRSWTKAQLRSVKRAQAYALRLVVSPMSRSRSAERSSDRDDNGDILRLLREVRRDQTEQRKNMEHLTRDLNALLRTSEAHETRLQHLEQAIRDLPSQEVGPAVAEAAPARSQDSEDGPRAKLARVASTPSMRTRTAPSTQRARSTPPRPTLHDDVEFLQRQVVVTGLSGGLTIEEM